MHDVKRLEQKSSVKLSMWAWNNFDMPINDVSTAGNELKYLEHSECLWMSVWTILNLYEYSE